jgi:putative hydrolase of HD superfamily
MANTHTAKVDLRNLVQIHEFLHQIEGLKNLLRHSWLSSGRQESVAEHTWRMAMMALLLHEQIEEKVDLGKVIQMILVHDLAEILAGDFHAFKEVPKNKHQLEQKALQQLVKGLQEKTQKQIISLWQEFEERKTAEGKFANALDKLEVLIQHNEADITTWEEKEYEFNYYYGYDKVAHSEVLTIFRDLILEETIEKIETELP